MKTAMPHYLTMSALYGAHMAAGNYDQQVSGPGCRSIYSRSSGLGDSSTSGHSGCLRTIFQKEPLWIWYHGNVADQTSGHK
jgi:hypothetical protein